jgi:ArsR family transcriptional regulator, arsenate/arsenite/antimonite-responsive transcriptional repressor / arsenate reductase (thioredoxin)
MLNSQFWKTANTMKETQPAPVALEVLKLFADDTRWRIIGELRHSDRQVGELVGRLSLPQNLVSYHLGLLRQVGLVQVHRSDADARVLYYGLDMTAVQAAYHRIGASLALPQPTAPSQQPRSIVVFLCTENSARSQIAEGWLRQLSQGRIPVRSAGTQPSTLHPLAVRAMAEVGVDIGYQQAKGLDAVSREHPDIVVTVCDRAREACAPCIEAPIQLHWSIPDPVHAARRGSDPMEMFRTVRDQLRVRIEGLLAALPTLTNQGTPPA